MRLLDLNRKWLEDFTWDEVTLINAGLCEKTHSHHGPTSDGHNSCKSFWLAGHEDETSCRGALDFLQSCHRLSPFCFNNGNTFAAIARELIYELNLPPIQATIARSAAGHYVAGVLRLDELTAALAEVTIDIEP